MKITRKLLLSLALLVLVSLCVLTMASCNKECSHRWGEWTVTEEPSCTEAGTRTRTCSECETPETESVAALSHSFSKYVSDDNGTCLANGTETATCDRCTATDTREMENSKNADRHASDEVSYRKNASDSDKHDKCYVCCGALIETQMHTWNDSKLDGTVTVYTCTDCGDTKRVPLPEHKHEATFVAAKGATCTVSGNVAYWYCESCDTYFADEALTEQLEQSETLVEKTAHPWDDGEIDGTVTVYTCTACGETKRVPLPDHEHAAAFVEEKAASCTESGNVAYWYCESCDGYFADEALTMSLTEAETVIAPTHTSTEFNYTVNAADGNLHDKCYACCGTVAETVAHTYEFHQNLMATCEQGGGEEYLCVCGQTKIENETPAAGHSVEFWDLVDETEKPDADCTYVQEWQGTCLSCVTLQSKTSTVVRHQFVATIETHPTCQNEGSKSYACHCGAVPEVATVAIPATPAAHAWDGGVTEGGVTTYTCHTEGCNETKTALVYANTTQTVSATDLADNELVLGGVALRLDGDTLSLLGDASDVCVSASPIDDRDSLIASLPETLRGQITDATPIYDFSLSADGVSITEFEGGVITITIPYTLPDGTDADCVSVWYVADDGAVEFYEATYVAVGDDGYLTFEATHFSTYLPALAPESDACELYGHNDIQTVVAPTCSAYGHTEYHCQRCGSSRLDNTQIPLGHAYDAGTSTPATCAVPGKTTYTCTREGCEHRLSMALYAPHSYEYNEEESCPATCTEDGYIIRTCTTCGATQREEQKAPGQHDMQSKSVALATGATSCTDGVVFTEKCWACGHTETETVYEHTPYDKYTDDEGNYLIPGETKIGLGSYLTEKGIAYSEEPCIIFEDGCLCGEQKSRIYMTNDQGQYGNELFTGWFEGFSWNSPPQNPSACQTVVLQTQSETVGDPMLGPVESPVFKVQFKQILEIDGCHYTYSVEVKIGYDEATGNAIRTETYVLAEYDSHSIQTTATVKDPSKSCYENCYDGSGSWTPGITVTDTCTKCGEVIRTYEDGVSNDSLHCWYDAETYDYKDEDCRENYYGVRVFIKNCPCGKSDYTLHTGDCSFTSQTMNDVTVYTCRDCGYIYAEKTVEIDSRDDCHRSKTKYLWLGCESVTDYESCEKTYVCVVIDEDVHYGQTQERESVPTDYPCYYHITLKTVCPTCGTVIRSSSYYGTEHDTTEATTTDSYGNVTTTESCSVDGCGYVHITVTDKDGHVLREYTVDKDYEKGEKTVVLLTYKMIWGSIRPMMERYEYYDLESGALLRWNETTYHYESDPDKGCFSTTVSINHKGELSQGGGDCLCCFDQTEEQMRTCVQDGYRREICSQCGRVEETWYEPARHEWTSDWMPVSPDGHTMEYHRCMVCGVCTKEPYWGESMDDVMPSYDGSDRMTVFYRCSENSTATGIDATYGFVAYVTDEYGQLVMDEDTNEPMAITLSGVNVTDDGEGSLSFSIAEAKTALESESLNEQYKYTVCFVVNTSCGVRVIPIR